jgi:hypothetical protein
LLDILELLVNERCSGSTRRAHDGRDPADAGVRPKRCNVVCGAPGGRALPGSIDASNGGKIKIDIFFS